MVHPGWEALVEDDYEAVMPLTGGRKFGINYLFQPFFTQKFGVFGKKEVSKEKIEEFLAAIPKKFKFAEFRMNISCTTYFKHRNIVRDINCEYSVITDSYSSNTKRDLAKAKKEKLQIIEDVEPSAIIDLFRKNRGKDIEKWGDKEYDRLLNLVEEAKKHDSCLVFGVHNADNQIVA
ncbi:MAG: hypothetical protein IKX01_01385 [Bacteroidales bacterium]|nr:hypothetical protein [Bacteroidales bacterium]